jgi:methionyl-tRNA synthetase
VFTALRETAALRQKIEDAYKAFDFQAAAAHLLERVDLANRCINDLEPWTLKKNGEEETLAALMVSLLEAVRIVAILFQPLLPNLSLDMLAQLGFGEITPYQLSFDAVGSHGFSKESPHVTAPTGPIMPRLDDELAGKDKKK